MAVHSHLKKGLQQRIKEVVAKTSVVAVNKPWCLPQQPFKYPGDDWRMPEKNQVGHPAMARGRWHHNWHELGFAPELSPDAFPEANFSPPATTLFISCCFVSAFLQFPAG